MREVPTFKNKWRFPLTIFMKGSSSDGFQQLPIASSISSPSNGHASATSNGEAKSKRPNRALQPFVRCANMVQHTSINGKTCAGALSVAFLLVLLFFIVLSYLDSILKPLGLDAEIEGLQDMGFVRSASFNCSILGLQEKSIVAEQQYHSFPSGQSLKNSCQSKYQQHCFWKNTGPKFHPPPAFMSAVKDYEEYHERCTRGYNLTELALGGDAPQNCSYLVWKAMDGMGNQLLSLVCAFIYSLLTRRAMLIATDSHIEQYICNPFPLSTWVLPDDFPEPRLRAQAPRVFTYLNQVLAQQKSSCGSISKDTLPQLIAQAPKHIHVYIICCDERRDHQFFCPTAQKLLSGSKWMFYKSHEYTLPGFYFVPEFREKLKQWFPQNDGFMHAARYLLNPENYIWAQISQFYRKHMDGVERQVGIQVRSWRNNFSPNIDSQIKRCAIEQKLLPKTLKEAPNQLENTIDRHKRSNISVLVASLRPEYHAHLAAEYADHVNEDRSHVDIFTASNEGSQRTGDKNHDVKAIADIWLLSFVHDLVITPFSTFGSTASGLGGIVPLLFNNYDQNKLNEPACGRTNLAGPCFIVYPRNQPCDLDPPRSSIFDPGAMLSEVKYCDFNPGLGVQNT